MHTPLAERVLRSASVVLLTGGERACRASLLTDLGAELGRLGASTVVVTTDLGLPFLGPPGASTRLRWNEGAWHVERIEALCTLDSARFRLPLLLAARRALASVSSAVVLVEAPRLTRGMASSELLTGLIEGMEARMVLSLGIMGELRTELDARGVEVLEIPSEGVLNPSGARAAGESRSEKRWGWGPTALMDVLNPSAARAERVPERERAERGARGALNDEKPWGWGPTALREVPLRERALARTEIWNQFLEGAGEIVLPFDRLPVLGAPPPRSAADAWAGRQVALLGADEETLAFGEIRSVGEVLHARVCRFTDTEPRALLVRDARRDSGGLLATAPPPAPRVTGESAYDLSPGAGIAPLRPPVVTLASAKALLVNGIFGDPLLHVRLRHRRRSLLFDLGESARLPARIVHQVSDVFISHAHFDHFGGFLWFLRSSIGSPRPRHLYGPPGLADHVEGMLAGIHWDRIGDRGPIFDVAELHRSHPKKLERFRLQAGQKGRVPLGSTELRGDVLVEEPEFRVRAAVLDHGIPVLAFAFEETTALHVRAEALSGIGLPAGPWLSLLKRLLLESRGEELVPLPDGSSRRASDLGAALIYSRPGQKLVYATDLDDSEENHRVLAALASDARVLFCEASFVEEDRELARATQHLTARGCASIAAAAKVEKLVPFHFSKRYERDPGRVYREVAEIFPAMVVAR